MLLAWTHEKQYTEGDQYWHDEEAELDKEIAQLENSMSNEAIASPASSPTKKGGWFEMFKTAAISSGTYIKYTIISKET